MNKKYVLWISLLFLFLPLACTLSAQKPQLSTQTPQKEGQKGGIQIILEADVPATLAVSDADMSAARKIVESRLNGLGIVGAEVVRDGDRRIAVILRGVANTDQVINMLYPTALLEFVDMSNITQEQAMAYIDAGTSIVTDLYSTEAVSDTQQIWHTVMTGADIKTASVSNKPGGYAVSFEMTSEGAQIFADFTSQHIGKVLAIVLDKKVISAPVINDTITGGKGVIAGNFTAESANALAVQLRYGALPVPLKVVETHVISPGP